jgi:Arc/MetJ-type ribon-helix-helix transcriptional regulator
MTRGASSVSFAMTEAERKKLGRLAKRFAGGNRSEFLRIAMREMEALDRAERLRRLQAFGAQQSARLGLGIEDVNVVVHRVLAKRGARA